MYELGLALEAQAKEEGVDIRLNTLVTKEYVEEVHPDAMVLAVGSSPIVPRIEGVDRDNVILVNGYYLNKDKVGDTVVVLGGGLAGCECAVHLAKDGKRVRLVEMRDALAVDANIRHRPILVKMVNQYVEVHTEYQGLKVTEDGLLCKDEAG